MHLPAPVVSALAAALLHAVWQCAVLACAADMALRAARHRSAAMRHGLGMCVLVAMAIVPACTFLLGLTMRDGSVRAALVPVAARSTVDTAAGAAWPGQAAWAAALCALWTGGVIAMLVRHAGGLWWLSRLDRRAVRPLPPEWRASLHALQRTIGISRTIVIHVADDILVPFTARLVRPVIWIPSALLTRLPRAQLEALLAHELAHVRRLDWLWNGVQCVIEALLFFHPGVWWLSRCVREERERACDAMAATACAGPVVLAEALAALARDRHARPRLVLAADTHPLLDRITLLLSGAPAPARPAPPLGLVAGMLTGAVLAVSLGSRMPVALHPANPAPMVEVSTVHSRIGPGVVKGSARRASDSGPRALDAGRGTAAVFERTRFARDTEPVALGREEVLRAAEAAMRAREQAVRVAEGGLRDPEDAARAAEDALHDREQAARVAEEVLRDPEKAARAKERAARIREGLARVAEQSARDAAQLARAAAPTAVRAVEVGTTARAVEAPTAPRAVEAPTAPRAVEAPTAPRAVELATTAPAVDAVKSVAPYAAHPVQALKVRTPPHKGSLAPQ